MDHLQDEAQVIIGAGTITTAHILATTTFYLIDNPSIRGKLQAELKPLIQETGRKPKWYQLEQLPYLSAITQEGLRTGNGISHRLQRVFPDTLLEYNGYTIPIITPVGMTPILVHNNVRTACLRNLCRGSIANQRFQPSLFPEPRAYNPDRFLKQPGLRSTSPPVGKEVADALESISHMPSPILCLLLYLRLDTLIESCMRLALRTWRRSDIS